MVQIMAESTFSLFMGLLRKFCFLESRLGVLSPGRLSALTLHDSPSCVIPMDLPPTKESLFIFDPNHKRHMVTKKEKRNTIAGCPFGHEMPVTCAQVELIISEARVTALPCHVIAHDPTSALPGLAQNPQNISYAEGQILFITVVLESPVPDLHLQMP